MLPVEKYKICILLLIVRHEVRSGLVDLSLSLAGIALEVTASLLGLVTSHGTNNRVLEASHAVLETGDEALSLSLVVLSLALGVLLLAVTLETGGTSEIADSLSRGSLHRVELAFGLVLLRVGLRRHDDMKMGLGWLVWLDERSEERRVGKECRN